MEFVKFSKMARLRREVIITEKIDGTNAAIVWSFDNPDDNTVAVVPTEVGPMSMWCQSRSRFIKPGDDNFGFAGWCAKNAVELASLGVGRHFGEWWGVGIQRHYDLTERRFSLFNTLRWNGPDAPKLPDCVSVVPELERGVCDTARIEYLLADLRRNGSLASPGFMDPEGVVVFHVAGNVGFKASLDNDDAHKGGA